MGNCFDWQREIIIYAYKNIYKVAITWRSHMIDRFIGQYVCSSNINAGVLVSAHNINKTVRSHCFIKTQLGSRHANTHHQLSEIENVDVVWHIYKHIQCLRSKNRQYLHDRKQLSKQLPCSCQVRHGFLIDCIGGTKPNWAYSQWSSALIMRSNVQKLQARIWVLSWCSFVPAYLAIIVIKLLQFECKNHVKVISEIITNPVGFMPSSYRVISYHHEWKIITTIYGYMYIYTLLEVIFNMILKKKYKKSRKNVERQHHHCIAKFTGCCSSVVEINKFIRI